MLDHAALRANAITLTRQALAALDAAGEDVSEVHVEHALAVLMKVSASRKIEEADEVLATPECKALLERLGEHGPH